MARLLIAVALAAATGCDSRLPAPPQLLAVTPPQGRALEQTEIRLEGGPFTVRVRHDLDSPTGPAQAASFEVTLSSGAVRITLGDVEWLSAGALSAVVPAGVPPGSYDVELRDGWGRTASLAGGFEVAAECLASADCDDGLYCTTERCVDYRCERPVSEGWCVIDGACHAAGAMDPDDPCQVCAPERAQTAWMDAVNGTACDDGNACTQGESCQQGACGQPTFERTCPSSECLGTGSCDPATGACLQPVLDGGCVDAYECTTGEMCSAGECRGTSTCGDTAPLACLTLSSAGAVAPAKITVDPSCTRDLESPDAALSARFALAGDGAFGPWAALEPVVATFATPGVYAIQLQVRDPAGSVDTAVAHVVVTAPARDLLVTTPLDEDDAGATPGAPGGTGLSLREAIDHANIAGGAFTIRFAAPMTVLATGALPELAAPGAAIAGGPGVRVDFSAAGASPACLRLAGNGQVLLGVEAYGCAATLLEVKGSGAVVMDSKFRSGAATGVSISGSRVRVGPGVEVSGFGGNGVQISGDDVEVTRAVINDNGLAGILHQVKPQSTGIQIDRTIIAANGGTGFEVDGSPSTTPPPSRAWNNTVHGNRGDGVALDQDALALDLRNNLLTSNLGCGASGPETSFVELASNGAHANVAGAYCGGAADGGVVADPGYLAPDAPAYDFRLRPGSPAIDAAAVVGLDGGYSGTLPDLGAHEAPYP